MVASALNMRVWVVLPLRPKPRYWVVLHHWVKRESIVKGEEGEWEGRKKEEQRWEGGRSESDGIVAVPNPMQEWWNKLEVYMHVYECISSILYAAAVYSYVYFTDLIIVPIKRSCSTLCIQYVCIYLAEHPQRRKRTLELVLSTLQESWSVLWSTLQLLNSGPEPGGPPGFCVCVCVCVTFVCLPKFVFGTPWLLFIQIVL